MTKMRKSILILVVAFAITCTAGLVGLFGFNTAFANTDANVQMVEGASVKVEKTGIRFQSRINKEYFDGLAEDKETGIAIIPQDLLTGELNENTENAALITAKADPRTDGEYYVYSYALTDITPNSYGRGIVARAFVKVGDAYTWANNAQTRSLAYVASAALYAESTGAVEYDKVQKDTLKGYINGAIANATVDNQQNLAVGESKSIITIEPKYATDNLSDLKVIYTSDNAEALAVEEGVLKAKKAGYAHIGVSIGSKEFITRATAHDEKYIISAAKDTQSIEFSLPEGYTAEFFLNDSTSLGDINSIVVPDAIKNDVSQHKLYSAYPLKLQVYYPDGTKDHFTRPNLFIATATVSSIQEWKDYVWPKNTTSVITGTYVLTQDIEQGSDGFNLGINVGDNGSCGFKGVLDGNNHSISISGSNGFGLFGALSNATVKNLTINKSGNSSGWSAGLLGTSVIGTTFENTVINITDATDTTSNQCGVFTRRGVWDSTFTNFTVTIKNSKIASLFGAENSVFRGLNAYKWNTTEAQPCTFNNCIIKLDNSSTLDEIGHRGGIAAEDSSKPLTVFTAQGHTPSNTPAWAHVETLTGITVEVPGETEQSLNSKQNVSVAEGQSAEIDLKEYSDYTVTKITCEDEDLGSDVKNLIFSENLKKNGN